MGMPYFMEGQVESRAKTRKAEIFPGKPEAFVPILPEALLLHILDQDCPSFYLRFSRTYQETYNFDFFRHFPKFVFFPSQFLGKILNLIIPPMCMLLKFDYTKFGVSNLFSSNVIEEKPLGVWLDPPPWEKRVK